VRYSFKFLWRGHPGRILVAAFALTLSLCLALTSPLSAVVVAGGRSAGVVAPGSQRATTETPVLSNPISRDDYRKVARYGRSYLARNSAGKELLYLEGDGYQRGFAEGRLCPESVYRMAHDFLPNVFFELVEEFGIEIDLRQYPVLWNILWSLLQQLVVSNEGAVPQEYRDEMRGMADACRQLGYQVTYNELMTLNVGIDALESIIVGFEAIFCNEFTVFGRATRNGAVYHGRDFMFFTGGDVFADESMLMVINPTQGHPLVAAAAPGFVGFPTAMNSRGVSCGMDVVFSIFTRPLVVGSGCLLMCRQAVQYGGSMEEATSIIKNADRGVPWLYMVADGSNPNGTVLETMASSMLPPGDITYDWMSRLFMGLMSLLFPGLREGRSIEGSGVADGNGRAAQGDADDLPAELKGLVPESARPRLEKGVMIRGADYVDPPWLDGLKLWLAPNGEPNPLVDFFPRQGETSPYLVAMTNHYIVPLMAATYPSLRSGDQDSLKRYDSMMALLLEAHGKINRQRAMWIIDFLNPGRCDYYGTDRTQSVKGHHVLMDNRSHEMWSLHGYYDQPWAHVDLDEVLRRR
jgi:hypothetical protein